MKYFDTKTQAQTDKESESTILTSDPRLESFFNPPSFHYDVVVTDGIPSCVEYVEPVKTNDQLIAEIDAELSALDATPRMLSGALMGDQWSIDKLKDLEIKQSALRDKRKALL